MKLRILIAAALCIASCGLAQELAAQTKTETKNYNKAVSKPSLKAYDNFLKKYPNSVYAADIAARKDTLLNISPYSEAQARELIGAFLPQDAPALAFAVRKDAVDRIHALCLGGREIEIRTIEKSGASWKELPSYNPPFPFQDEYPQSLSFIDSHSVMKIKGETFLCFNVLAAWPNSRREYRSVCYSPDSDFWGYLSFSGKDVHVKDDSAAYRISGRFNETMEELRHPQLRVLLSAMKENALLEEIPDKDWKTDLAIEFWQKNNPDAMGAATKLTFNILDKDCSLVESFAKAKGKVESSKYRAAIMDIRGWSVIVVFEKESGNYVLAWAEPECKDHKKDRLLNSLYFKNPYTLTMYYYQGSKSFSYELNLASKKLSR